MTLTEIAEVAGVSIATVSRVYNRKNLNMVGADTRERIERLLKEYHYHPDPNGRRLITGKSKLIGFQVPSIRRPIVHSASLEAITKQACEYGYGVLVNFPDKADSDENCIQYMIDQGVDGIIWQPMKIPSDRILHRIEDRKVKVLWFRPNFPVEGIRVELDEEKVGEIAGRYLVNRGMKKFYAFVDSTWGRYEAFCRVVTNAGFDEPVRIPMKSYTQETVPDSILSIIDSNVGIFSYFARFASVVDEVRVQKGKTDCCICSYGDEVISKEYGVRFPLISSNAGDIGYYAFHSVMSMIEGDNVSDVKILPKLLV